jgi:hypothetical protein
VRFRVPERALAVRLDAARAEPRIDTLVVDLDAMRLSVVWRFSTPRAAGVEEAVLVVPEV